MYIKKKDRKVFAFLEIVFSTREACHKTSCNKPVSC